MNRDTICVQGGYTPGNGEPRQIPIIQSTTFKYATSEDMGKLFDLEADGYFYSRLQNPTCDMVAKKICELEGGTAAMLTSSGQAANFFALFNICEAGDHIVASSTIYGGTFNLFSVTMKRMGIEFTFVDPNCSEEELAKRYSPQIGSRLEGEFLDYKNAIPRRNPISVTVDTKAMLESLDRVSVVISEKLKSPVRCQFGEDKVTMSAKTANGDAKDVCRIAGDGQGLEIGFNNRYLMDALRYAPADTVRMELNTGISPAIIVPVEGEENFLYMVLPVRLKAN